jgi:GNAT superfamily N-acetyltransferase
MEIRELTTDDEFRAAWAVMRELRSHLDEETFMQRVGEMRPSGYRLIAGEEDGTIVALAGIGTEKNLYYGRYMWVYDLITTEKGRSKGHGLALMERVEELAREEGCDVVGLSSALHRTDAHRFYLEKVGMDKRSYTFTKDLG